MVDQVKTFTLQELQSYSTEDSLWIAIHNKVYDVTDFIDKVS